MENGERRTEKSPIQRKLHKGLNTQKFNLITQTLLCLDSEFRILNPRIYLCVHMRILFGNQTRDKFPLFLQAFEIRHSTSEYSTRYLCTTQRKKADEEIEKKGEE